MQLQEKIGSVSLYEIKTPITVLDLLKELHLDNKTFVVLKNGKRVDLDELLDPNDQLTILPKIAGG